MSGGTDTVTTQNFPSWAVPSAQNFLQKSQEVANLPYQAYTGQTVAQLNPYQTQGFNTQAARAMQGSPLIEAAGNEVNKTLSGGYLNANPYMDALVNKAQGDVVRNYNLATKPALEASMARSGSFGNTGLAQMQAESQRQLQDSLGNISTQLRGGDYAAERARMQSAIPMAQNLANQDYTDAAMLQQAGQGFRTAEQQNMDDAYRRFLEARDYPQQQLNTLGKGLGLNYGSTQQIPGVSPVSQAAGTGLAAYGLYNMGQSGGGK